MTRKDILELRHWEVVEILESYSRQKASSVLSYADAVALGSGTISDSHDRQKIIDDYQDRAKATRTEAKREKEEQKHTPWTLDLKNI